MAKTNSTRQGRNAEQEARRFLESSGLIFIAGNYHAPGGELDLIMQDGVTLVFVEVRLRHISRFGDAIESITRKKQARITMTAAYYLQQYPQWADHPCRFDIVAFNDTEKAPLWLKGAFGI